MIIVVETFLAHRHTLLTLFFGDSGKGRISNIGSSKLIDQGMYSVTQEIMSNGFNARNLTFRYKYISFYDGFIGRSDK